jgi:hypothetical protein
VKRTAFLAAILVTLAVSSGLGQVREGAWTPATENLDRGYSSISYWTYRDDGVEIGGGRISVEHGKPSWPAELETQESFDGATVGKLWRLGNNKWTTLDTNLPLRFGERRIEPGIYYLVIRRPSAAEWRLSFVSPAAVMPELIDAWASQARPREVPILFDVPLRYSASGPKPELDITLGLDEGNMDRGALRIEWGPHRLETELSIEMVSPTFYRTKRQSP